MPFDFDYYKSNANPYAPRTNLWFSPDTQVASTFGNAVKAGAWNATAGNRYYGGGPGYLGNSVWNPATSRMATTQSPWGIPSSYGTQPVTPWTTAAQPTAGGIPPTSVGPYTSIALTKDPEIEAMTNAITQKIGKGNTWQLVRQPRSEELNVLSGRAYERMHGDINNADQSIADYNREFLTVRPVSTKALDQETASLARIHAPATDTSSLEYQLNQAAENEALRRSQVQASLRNAITRTGNKAYLQGGGSNYIDAIIAAQTGDLLARDALARSATERANLMDLAQLRASTAGRTNQMVTDYVNQGLLPLQASLSTTGQIASNLGALGQLDLANTYAIPYSEALSNELGLLGATRALRGSNRYEGLYTPYRNTNQGFLPIRSTGQEPLPFRLEDLLDQYGYSGADDRAARTPTPAVPTTVSQAANPWDRYGNYIYSQEWAQSPFSYARDFSIGGENPTPVYSTAPLTPVPVQPSIMSYPLTPIPAQPNITGTAGVVPTPIDRSVLRNPWAGGGPFYPETWDQEAVNLWYQTMPERYPKQNYMNTPFGPIAY